MTRTLEVQMETSKVGKRAISYFFRKHRELSFWKEQFQWMLETNTDFFSDDKMADGTRNKDWSYALHLDITEGHTYICIIERS